MLYKSFVVPETTVAQSVLLLLERIVPLSPTAITWPEPLPARAVSALVVGEVRGVHVIASGLVRIVPRSPTATNTPLRYCTAFRLAVVPEVPGVQVVASSVENVAPFAPTATSSATAAVVADVYPRPSRLSRLNGFPAVHVDPARRGTKAIEGEPDPPGPPLWRPLTGNEYVVPLVKPVTMMGEVTF